MTFETEIPYVVRTVNLIKKVLLTIVEVVIFCSVLFWMLFAWNWLYGHYPMLTTSGSVVLILMATLVYMCMPRSKGWDD